ncbi:hypothetical protein PHYPSEUDO_013616 [Phytophthora pseudosyringae]|uniref:glucan endo-1,3-beta-D-glucosidase n=1 Tax=Phytophthora pseudosyringae TaxID=221518 RepID=A0A8T1W369_9STRA|nr:hypothetical protein PHYPSEUDO_013616 [Phytophthora pseudosyringae]
MKELDAMIDMILRNVANPSTQDAFFPKFRHFSFYLGHSYSHSVTPMADETDEEKFVPNHVTGIFVDNKAA